MYMQSEIASDPPPMKPISCSVIILRSIYQPTRCHDIDSITISMVSLYRHCHDIMLHTHMQNRLAMPTFGTIVSGRIGTVSNLANI